jgi:hypothetical protein
MSLPVQSKQGISVLRFQLTYSNQIRDPALKGSVVYLSEWRISLVVGAINILLAAAFLFGAIYNLYYVQDERTTLGLIAAYTTAFALCIGLLTAARSSEIFGACAAYAAVLVVFVSSDLGSRCNGAIGTHSKNATMAS